MRVYVWALSNQSKSSSCIFDVSRVYAESHQIRPTLSSGIVDLFM